MPRRSGRKGEAGRWRAAWWRWRPSGSRPPRWRRRWGSSEERGESAPRGMSSARDRGLTGVSRPTGYRARGGDPGLDDGERGQHAPTPRNNPPAFLAERPRDRFMRPVRHRIERAVEMRAATPEPRTRLSAASKEWGGNDRHQHRSTIVTSQLPADHWHQTMADPTLADAILDRLVHNAHHLKLKGESMRKQTSALQEADHLRT